MGVDFVVCKVFSVEVTILGVVYIAGHEANGNVLFEQAEGVIFNLSGHLAKVGLLILVDTDMLGTNVIINR